MSTFILTTPTTSGNTSVGGDPHVKPIFGSVYSIPSQTDVFRLFDNRDNSEKIIVNGKMWILPPNLIKEKHFPENTAFNRLKNISINKLLKNFTFIKYVSILYITIDTNESIIIDMDSMNLCQYTNDEDVNNHCLPIIEDEDVSTTYIVTYPREESKLSLYSVSSNKMMESKNAISRVVEINTKKMGNIVFTLVSDPDDTFDRNHVSIDCEKNLHPANCFGSLVKKEDCCVTNGLLDDIFYPSNLIFS